MARQSSRVMPAPRSPPSAASSTSTPPPTPIVLVAVASRTSPSSAFTPKPVPSAHHGHHRGVHNDPVARATELTRGFEQGRRLPVAHRHPGGIFRLWDVVYSFTPAEAEGRIEAWCSTGRPIPV